MEYAFNSKYGHVQFLTHSLANERSVVFLFRTCILHENYDCDGTVPSENDVPAFMILVLQVQLILGSRSRRPRAIT